MPSSRTSFAASVSNLPAQNALLPYPPHISTVLPYLTRNKSHTRRKSVALTRRRRQSRISLEAVHMRLIRIAYTVVVQKRGALSCLVIRNSSAISSVSFFLGSDFGLLTRDDGAIEVALGCGWRTMVADTWCDRPCERDVR